MRQIHLLLVASLLFLTTAMVTPVRSATVEVQSFLADRFVVLYNLTPWVVLRACQWNAAGAGTLKCTAWLYLDNNFPNGDGRLSQIFTAAAEYRFLLYSTQNLAQQFICRAVYGAAMSLSCQRPGVSQALSTEGRQEIEVNQENIYRLQ